MRERPPTPEELRAKVRDVQTAKNDDPEQMRALMALMDVEYTFRFAALVDRIEALAEHYTRGGYDSVRVSEDDTVCRVYAQTCRGVGDRLRAILRKPLEPGPQDNKESV